MARRKSQRSTQRASQRSLASQERERSASTSEGLDPLLYVALHTGNVGDVAFYVERCLGEEALHMRLDEDGASLPSAPQSTPHVSVLELGCGAGRVSLPLLEAGARVVGVDTHAGLLSLLERTATDRGLARHLKLIHQDMRTLQLKERFDFILITYNTLYCALSWDEQVDCLSRAASHLKPQGQLLIDGYALPDPEEYVYESDEDYEPLTVVELPELKASGALPDERWRLSDLQYLPLSAEDLLSVDEVQAQAGSLDYASPTGLATQANLALEDEELSPEEEARLVGVEERDVHDQPAQRCEVHYRFRWASGVTREEVISHRYLFPAQLPEMLESAGLSVERWWRDFEPHDLNADDWGEQWAVSATLRGQKRLK